MSMLSIFNVSGSAASAQSQRLNVVASNLANADTVAGPNGQAYKARQVTFQTELVGQTPNDPTSAGVRVSTISEDQTPGRKVHDPKHPSADAEGYVDVQQRQRRRGDGQHDLGLALLPEQPRGDEHREVVAPEDDPARPGLIAQRHTRPRRTTMTVQRHHFDDQRRHRHLAEHGLERRRHDPSPPTAS